MSLDYKENALEIMSNSGLHIFDRLLFLRKFRTVRFKKILIRFLEESKQDHSLEALIFFFHEKDLTRDILQTLLGKSY